MKFFRIPYLLFFILMTTGFSAASQNAGNIPFNRLEGYDVRPSTVPQNGFYTELYYINANFDQNFAPRPGSTKIIKPDFKKYYVLACAGSKTGKEAGLKLDKLIKKQTALEVYFVTTPGKRGKSVPSCLYTIPIDRSLNGMVYYVNGKVVQEIGN